MKTLIEGKRTREVRKLPEREKIANAVHSLVVLQARNLRATPHELRRRKASHPTAALKRCAGNDLKENCSCIETKLGTG